MTNDIPLIKHTDSPPNSLPRPYLHDQHVHIDNAGPAEALR